MMFSKLFVSFKEGIVFWNSSRRLLFRIFIIILYNFAFHLLNNRMQMSMVIEFTIVIRNTWYECRNIKWWRFPSFSFLSKKELFFEIFLDDYYFVFSIILYNFASHLLDNRKCPLRHRLWSSSWYHDIKRIEFTIVIRNTWYECRNIKWFSFLSKKELFFEIFLDDNTFSTIFSDPLLYHE